MPESRFSGYDSGMTTEQLRTKASAILEGRKRGARAKAMIVTLRDRTTFTGVLVEHNVKRTANGPREQLSFSLGDGEVRAFELDSISEL